jgi:EAL domain-containing protein (putative c-di-GMP-specific phosphodiesterase class I)
MRLEPRGIDRTSTVAAAALEVDLRRALDRSELTLGYEPVVSLDSGRLVAFRAEVSWNHPHRGRLAPAELVLAAQVVGHVARLADWVVRSAVRQLASWMDRLGPEAVPPLSVSLPSPWSVPCDFAGRAEEALERSGVPGRLLGLEVTKTALLHCARLAPTVLQRLAELGVGVSVDLDQARAFPARLQGLAVAAVRIDLPCPRTANTSDAEPLRAAVASAHRLGLRVIAKGVSTREQRQQARAAACDAAEGRLFEIVLDSTEAGALIRAPRCW